MMKRILAASFAVLFATSFAFGAAIQADRIIATGTAPALTSCGTTPAIVGSDTAGTVTMGTGSPTGCVITFNVAYATAPSCVASWGTNIASMIYAVTATTITLTQTATSSNKVSYICMAAPGG